MSSRELPNNLARIKCSKVKYIQTTLIMLQSCRTYNFAAFYVRLAASADPHVMGWTDARNDYILLSARAAGSRHKSSRSVPPNRACSIRFDFAPFDTRSVSGSQHRIKKALHLPRLLHAVKEKFPVPSLVPILPSNP